MRMRVYLSLILIFLSLISCVSSKRGGAIESVDILTSPPYYVGKVITFHIKARGIDTLRITSNGDEVYNSDFREYISLDLKFGENILKFEGFDEDGDLVGEYTLEPIFVHDPTPPSVNLMVEPENPTDSSTFVVVMEARDPESGLDESFIENLDTGERKSGSTFETSLKSGVYRFMGYAKNGDGKSTSKVLKVTVRPSGDLIPPRISFESPTHVLPGSSFEVRVIVADDKALDFVEILLNGSVLERREVRGRKDVLEIDLNLKASSVEGTMNLRIIAKDLAGNETERDIDILVSDNSPPVLSMDVSNNNPNVGETIVIRVSAEDDDGISKIELYLGDELLTRSFSSSLVYRFTVDFEGTEKLTAIAYDNLGAFSKIERSITVRGIDNTPPFVKISVPSEVPLGEIQTIRAVVFDESPIVGVNFRIFKGEELLNTLEGEKEADSIYSADYTFSSLGEYRISVKAVDAAGNSAEDWKDVNVLSTTEIESPKISFSIYPKILSMEDVLNAVVIAEDPDGLSRADFFVDDTLVDSDEFGTSNRLDFQWKATLYGEHTARVIVFDVEGNYSEASENFIVETEKPTAVFLYPSSDSELPFSEGLSIEIVVKVLDSLKPERAYFDIVGPDSTTLEARGEGEGPDYTYHGTWTPSSPGDYTVRFRYTNSMGLSCEIETRVHLKDTEVIFREPSSNVHTAGHDMRVWIVAAPDVEEGELLLITPDGEEHPVDLNVEERSDGTKSFTGTIPGTLFMTLTDAFNYSLKFTAISGSVRNVYYFYFSVVDNEPPNLRVEIDGDEIEDGTSLRLRIDMDHTIRITAEDNYALDHVGFYKNLNPVLVSPSGEIITSIPLDLFENEFSVKAVDTEGNYVKIDFDVYAFESNPPVATPSSVTLTVVEGGILNVNSESEITYSDFEISDDTGLEKIYYILTGPMGYEFDGTLWKGNGDTYARISVDRVGSFYVKVGDTTGFYELSLKAVDVFGNEITLGSTVIEVRDLVNPVVNLEIGEEDILGYRDGLPIVSGNGVRVRVYAIDNIESVKKIGLLISDPSGSVVSVGESHDFPGNYYDFDLDTIGLNDGVAVLTGVATTSSGASASSTIGVVIDNFRNPYVMIVLPDSPIYDGKRVYSGVLNVGANVSGISVPYDIEKVILEVDNSTVSILGEPFESGSVDIPLDTTGYVGVSPHTLTVRVIDRAGNISDVLDGVNSHTVIFDNYPPIPEYAFTYARNAIVTSELLATVTFLEDTAIGGVLFNAWRDSLNVVLSTERGNATVVGDREVVMDISPLFTTEGTAQYDMYSYDLVGNEGVSTGILYYDTSPPVGTISYLSGLVDDIATDSVILGLSLFDPVTWVSTVNLWATNTSGESQSGVAYSVRPFTLSTSLIWEPFDESEGTAEVIAEFFDPLEHVASDSTLVFYDTLAPRLEFRIEDAATSMTYGGIYFTDETEATISWIATDMTFKRIESTVKIGGTVISDFSSTDSSGTVTLGLSGDASHTVELTAWDIARSASTNLVLVNDQTDPVINRAILVNLTTNDSSVLYDGSVITLSSEELGYLFDLRVEFEESWPDPESMRLISEDNMTTVTASSSYPSSVSFVLRFTDDDTLTVYIGDVVSHEASWVFHVDVR